MQNDIFIGTGRNPHGPDLPLGLGMRLAQEPDAMHNFGQLSDSGKTSLIRYIQAVDTGDEAARHIEKAISDLKEGRRDWSR